MHKVSSISDAQVSETGEQESRLSSHEPPRGDSDCTHQQLPGSQQRKKKSKKHKDKERERLKDNQGDEWMETSPDLKHNLDKFDSKAVLYILNFKFKNSFVTHVGHFWDYLCVYYICHMAT